MLPTKSDIKDYYLKNNTKYIITVDFDDTLCQHAYPKCGTPIKPICDYIKYIQTSLYVELILWTCRTGDPLIAAIDWCNENEIYFNEINRQGEFDSSKFTESRKVYCNLSIDNTAYSFNIDDFIDFNNTISTKNNTNITEG